MSQRGAQRERAVKAWLEDRDWWVARTAGSLGDADLVALKQGQPARLVEVKSTHRGPFHSFGPKDRADILFAAELAGCEAWLAWWPPRGQLRWFHSSEWPNRHLEVVA